MDAPDPEPDNMMNGMKTMDPLNRANNRTAAERCRTGTHPCAILVLSGLSLSRDAHRIPVRVHFLGEAPVDRVVRGRPVVVIVVIIITIIIMLRRRLDPSCRACVPRTHGRREASVYIFVLSRPLNCSMACCLRDAGC